MFYLGLDISKANIDCCLLNQVSMTQNINKVFSNTHAGFENLLKWLIDQHLDLSHCIALMETTAVYHENLAYYLYRAGVQAYVINPERIQHFIQDLVQKNNMRRSEVLVAYAVQTEMRLWRPDSDNIRLLKALKERRATLLNSCNGQGQSLNPKKMTPENAVMLKLLNNNIAYLTQERCEPAME